MQGQVAAERQHADLTERGHRLQPGRQPSGQPHRTQSLAEQGGRGRAQAAEFALFLAEALDHPDAGDVLLDDLRHLGRRLLGGPGRREQRFPGGPGQQDDRRDDHQGGQGEQRRQDDHDDQGHRDQDHLASRPGQHGDEALHHLQVTDGAGDQLAGAELVLSGAVQSLQGTEDVLPQVVLHVQGQPATGPATHERRSEPDQGERHQRGDQPAQPLRRARGGPVHRGTGDQRTQRTDADAAEGGHRRGHRDPLVPPAVAEQTPDPALVGGRRGHGGSCRGCAAAGRALLRGGGHLATVTTAADRPATTVTG